MVRPLCLALVLAPALAAQDPPSSPGSTNPVLEAARRVPLTAVGEHLPIRFGFRAGGARIVLEFAGPVARARRDGEALPSSRLVNTRGRWFYLDAEGGVVASVELAERGGRLRLHERRFHLTLGITADEIPVEKRLLYELEPRQGLEVLAVREETPAARAGLKDGDVLVALDGERPVTRTRLRLRLAEARPGQSMVFEVLRGGERLEVGVVLEQDYGAFLREGGEGDRTERPLAPDEVQGLLSGQGKGRLVLIPREPEPDGQGDREIRRRLDRLEALVRRILERLER